MAASIEVINPWSIPVFRSILVNTDTPTSYSFYPSPCTSSIERAIQCVALALRGERGPIPRVTVSCGGFLWWGSPDTDSRRGAEFVPGIQFNIQPRLLYLLFSHPPGRPLHALIPRFRGISI